MSPSSTNSTSGSRRTAGNRARGTPGHFDVRPVRHDRRVGGVRGRQVGDLGEREEAVAHRDPRLRGAEPEVVELSPELRPAQTEDLDRTAEFERVGVLVDDHHDPV
jgi:hypothetical protein